MARWLPIPSWRLLRRMVFVAALAVASSVIYHELGPRREGVQRLRTVIEQLDRADAGWRLTDLEAARATVPASENSASDIRLVAEKLPNDFFRFPAYTDLLDWPPEELFRAKLWADLRDRLENVQPTIANARSFADRPRGRFPITLLPNLLETQLPHLNAVRAVANLLALDANRLAQEGDGDGALRSSRACLHMATPLGDEPLLISQLVRAAIWSVAGRAIERTLAQAEPSERELTAMQAALEHETPAPLFHIGIRGDRAMHHELLTNLANGIVTMRELSGSKNDSDWSVTEWYIRRYRLADDHADLLTGMTQLVEATTLPEAEQARVVQQVHDRWRKSQGLFVRLLMPASVKVHGAELRGHAEMRCTIALLAAERYRRDHGRLPDSLDVLVPNHLAQVPDDPFDGQPMRIRRDADKLVIYSVGPDLADNGGTFNRKNPIAPNTDVGRTLWEVRKRRQQPSESDS